MSTPIVRRRKRPVEVDTIQWLGDNIDDVIDFTGGDFLFVNPGEEGFDPAITAKVFDELHDTWVGVKTGQHIVRGVKREFYPIAEDVLAETYELAGGEAATEVATATVRAVVHAALRTVQGGLHHLGLVTLEVLADRVTEAVTPLVTGSPAPTADTDFFQVGHTYANEVWRFHCGTVTAHPATGEQSALGWLQISDGGWTTYAYSADAWGEGWTDITQAGDA